MFYYLAFYAVIAILVLLFLSAAIKILREYERGVVFTLGRFTGVKGPGLIILIPFVQQMVRVDLRTRVLDVPTQDVISRDNVSVRVNAVIYFRVIDPERAIIQVEDFMQATSQLAQTTLRSVLGKHELDEMLAERDKLNTDIQEILDAQTDAWGIKVPMSRSSMWISTRPWFAPLPGRPRPSARGVPRSSMPKASSRRPRNCSKRLTSSPGALRPCSCAILVHSG